MRYIYKFPIRIVSKVSLSENNSAIKLIEELIGQKVYAVGKAKFGSYTVDVSKKLNAGHLRDIRQLMQSSCDELTVGKYSMFTLNVRPGRFVDVKEE